MSRLLPRLRTNLEFLPSPMPDRPGLLIRDAFAYSDVSLIIPPALVECLTCFDGTQTDLDLRALLVRMTGDLRSGEAGEHLFQALQQAGFLEDEHYEALKERKHREFQESPVRPSILAGRSYPDEPSELRAQLDRYFRDGDAPAPEAGLAGIAAPHVSLEGGYACYRSAYQALPADFRDRVFVILGTSHYGAPETFGLTRKPFRTPLGDAVTESGLAEELASKGGPAAQMEDYCHSIEHSIEFQVLALQHKYGPDVRILPVLCGPYAQSLSQGGKPEDDPGVAQFLDALREIASREGERLAFVMGVDMAHIGRRYGDGFAATARQGRMAEVERLDRERIARIEAGDAEGFWELVQKDQDPLHWCGSSALYTFLRVRPQARGRLLRYEQWNIDPESVVSFAALAFHEAAQAANTLK
ncbi:MAG: AmmeMemoRadiSam system protein B [Bryobacteraceae bacterium]|nr:AmmeMemoRadiSam system protein B [Bryobacteraceae bacterium]